VTERTIARRWVRALLELALEANEADSVLGDLRQFGERSAGDVAARAALDDPRASKTVKKESAGRLLPPSAKALTRDFVNMAIDRGRAEILAVAHEEFAAMLRDQRGEAVAEVVSSAALDAESKTALLIQLEKLTRKKITLHERIDASLRGGLRVKVGSLLLDGSGTRRLSQMREELMRVALPKPAVAE
jgi:F-type H+-transporting ATPase subunit delta